MDGNSNGPRARPNAVAQSAPQQSLARKACKHKDQDGKPGCRLLKTLRRAISTPCRAVGAAYLGEPRVVSYRSTTKAPWPFGDIARTNAALYEGWTVGGDLPRRLCNTTPARVPAAMIVSREGAMP